MSVPARLGVERRIGRRAAVLAMLIAISGALATLPSSAGASPRPSAVSISTRLSAASIAAGGSVYDTATLANFTAVPGVSGGAVSYLLWRGSSLCPSTTTPLLVNTVSVSPTGSVPNSSARTFTAVGADSWKANYSGNANNPASLSPCEALTVNPTATSIATNLSAAHVGTGVPVHDTATLSNATPTAAGTVTYEYFLTGNCSGTSSTVSIVAVASAVVPASGTHTYANAGNYGWKAIYSGDANNSGATSGCELLNVTHLASVSVSTSLSQRSIPVGGSVYDRANLTGATASASGTLTYELYDTNACTGSPTPIATVPVYGGVAADSPNQSFYVAGGYGWEAVYGGDTNDSPATGACEPLSVTPAVTVLSTNLTIGPDDALGIPIPATSPNGELCQIAFDPSNGYLYATMKQANGVMVVNGATNAIVTTVAVGSEPCGIAYDASTHDVYVANFAGGGSGTVSVIAGTGVVATVPVGSGPGSIAYDSRNGELYVANTGSASLSLLCDGALACGGPSQSNRITATVTLSGNPYGAVVFDSTNGELFVPGSGSTFVVSGTSVTSTISTPSLIALGDGAFDPANGDVYLPSMVSVLTIINGGTNVVLTNLGLSGYPLAYFAAAYDSANGEVYVPDQTGGLNAVLGTSVVNYLALAPEAKGVGYDSTTNVVYLGVTVSNQNELLPVTPVESARDAASLAGATAGAGGTVTYNEFSGTGCAGAPTTVSTVTVTSGIVPPSAVQTFPTSSYSWDAVYSGDANNSASTSPCEPMAPPPSRTPVAVANLPTLSFAVESFANVLITAPAGAASGFRANGTPISAAPGSLLLGPGAEPQMVSFLNPAPGRYRIDLFGNASAGPSGAPFELVVALSGPNGTGATSVSLHGTISAGADEVAYLTLAANGSISLEPASSPSGAPTPPAVTSSSVVLGAAIVVAAASVAAVSLFAHRRRRRGNSTLAERAPRPDPDHR